MKKHRNMIGILAVTAMLAAPGFVLAADAAPADATKAEAKKADGTVTIDETQFAFIIGGSTGGGKLTFQGKTYDFKIGGLTAGVNVGITTMSAAGEVYDLKDVSKFPGTYTKIESGVALAGGVSGLHLKNENGVVMKLTSRSQGLQLNVVSASGVKVTMK
ncbi:MAG: hypothetical protein MUE79_04460 [Nitratireductor sp.]|nr:hypothetical protein [Nitratireductor sp.]